MISLTRERFQQLVAEAIDSLPKNFRGRIKNVAVLVEDLPSPEIVEDMGLGSPWDLFGLYHGIPYGQRGSYYGNYPPDVILIFQKPLERYASTEDEIRDEVRATVIHEVGHYFGFDDVELGRIEHEIRRPDKESNHGQEIPRDLPRSHNPLRRRRHRRPPLP
ncbi:MAG: metallopeptidase family protein [Candidatus Aminicenantes bacterium]|nr:metallopeptidase family protein [Candidatus Aminicenantes bacterium]